MARIAMRFSRTGHSVAHNARKAAGLTGSGPNRASGMSTPFEFWLCPALFAYFDRAPQDLYVQKVRSWSA